MEFIESTIGLRAFSKLSSNWYLVRFQFNALENGNVLIQPVSGHNLDKIGKSAVISKAQFEDRPQNDIELFRFAANACDWTLNVETAQRYLADKKNNFDADVEFDKQYDSAEGRAWRAKNAV